MKEFVGCKVEINQSERLAKITQSDFIQSQNQSSDASKTKHHIEESGIANTMQSMTATELNDTMMDM